MSEKKRKSASAYVELLKDPRWQKKRLEILERDAWRCQMCDADDKTLHVHHKRYQWGKKPWEYDERELVTLCENCHEATTITSKRITAALGDVDPIDLGRVLGYLHGLFLGGIDGATGKHAIALEDAEHAQGIADAFSVNDIDMFDAARATDYRVTYDMMNDLQQQAARERIESRRRRSE